MLNPFKILHLMFLQFSSAQSLQRVPESQVIMTDHNSVEGYNQASESRLAIVYAIALELIYQSRRGGVVGVGIHNRIQSKALDLCCGPGHFTLFLAKYFDFDQIIGRDLSPEMIELARKNALELGLSDRVQFEVADALALRNEEIGTFELVTCNDASHHLPDIESVEKLTDSMNRLISKDGVALLIDMVRLRSENMTNRYVQLIGQDYLDRGLVRFYQDFSDSMRACWTCDELKQCTPLSNNHVWLHRAPKILPVAQILMGYPNDGRSMKVRKGFPWEKRQCPVPQSMWLDWQLLRAFLR